MRTPSGGPGTNQYSAVNPEGGHPHVVEGVNIPLQRPTIASFMIFYVLRQLYSFPIIITGIFVGF